MKASLKVGSTVTISYVDQEHDNLKAEHSVWEAISEGNELMMVGGREINSRAYVSKFNFSGLRSAKEGR